MCIDEAFSSTEANNTPVIASSVSGAVAFIVIGVIITVISMKRLKKSKYFCQWLLLEKFLEIILLPNEKECSEEKNGT